MSELSYLGENWIFMIFFLCISCITVLWGKPVNLPALNKTPLQRCTRCTVYSAPSPVEEGMSGGSARAVLTVCAVCTTSLLAWSQADRQQLPAPGATPRHFMERPFMDPCSVTLSFLQPKPGLAQGCSLIKAVWASPPGVWSSSAWSQVNERRPWLLHLIDWLMIFQPGHKSWLPSVSFSELSTKEMLTSPPCDAQGARCFPAVHLPSLFRKKRGAIVHHNCGSGIFKTIWLTLALVLFPSSHAVNS